MKRSTKSIVHYPNLQTVLMVERILKREKDITRTELKKKLPKKIMHQTLNVIIKYLEDSGKVIDHRTGVIWTYCPPEEMEEIRKNTISAEELFRKLDLKYKEKQQVSLKDEKRRIEVRVASRAGNRENQRSTRQTRI